jgi:hypothetical protein
MTVRAAIVLGIFLVVAAAVHGGLYAPGHDFVVNRFTGRFQFVPAEEDDEGSELPARAQCLTLRRAAATRFLSPRRR